MVVTRDICAEIARGAFGAARRITPDVLRDLSNRWRMLEYLHNQERATPSLASLASLGASLSPRSAHALEAFVERMVAAWPDRYGEAALRRRCRNSVAQACTGCVGTSLMNGAGLTSEPLFADAALALLAMGLWCSLTSVQLGQTYRIVKRLAERAQQAQQRIAS